MRRKSFIRKGLLFICCGTVALSPMSIVNYSQAAENDNQVKEYLVQTESNTVYQDIAKEYHEELLDDESEPTFEKENILLMNLTSEEASDLEKQDGISVEQNITFCGKSADQIDIDDVERLAEEQWNVAAIEAENPSSSLSSKNVKVAILDSGVDSLGDMGIKYHTSLIPGENADDMTGHGTIIANLIARNNNGSCEAGIIPENSSVELYNVRILDDNNQTPLSRVIEGLQWCIDNEMDIVNMSFGTEIYSDILQDMVRKAEAADILMIASVGNEGEERENIVEYPAGYPEVMGVGSVNEKMERSTFSNTGDAVEVMAPGENIPVTSYWGMQGVSSGTSYAAAHVTAVSALLWSENPNRNAKEIRSLLKNSATAMGNHFQCGYGLVNYQYAQEHEELAEEIIPEKNLENKLLQSYTIPVSLKASWAGVNHMQLIPSVSGMTAKEIEVIKYATKYADTSFMKDYDVLHARGNTNYVSAAKILFQAARTWKGGSNYQVLFNEAESYSSSGEDETTRYVDTMDLKESMKVAVYSDFQDSSKTGSKVSANRGRLQLLGLAIHVAGDAYAHKAMCDGSAEGLQEIQNIYDKNADKIKPALQKGETSIEEIKSMAQSDAGLTTARMGNQKYFKDAGVCNKYYTDSPGYMSDRYCVATKVATNKLLNYYSNSTDFKPFVFCPYEISETKKYAENYKYKVRHLVQNIQDAGYNIMNYLKGKNDYTVSDWYALSFNS